MAGEVTALMELQRWWKEKDSTQATSYIFKYTYAISLRHFLSWPPFNSHPPLRLSFLPYVQTEHVSKKDILYHGMILILLALLTRQVTLGKLFNQAHWAEYSL